MSEVKISVGDEPTCMLCLGPGLFAVRFPQTLPGSLGAQVGGSLSKVLCPQCDRDVPQAAELIALFAVDDQVGKDNAPEFLRLVSAWVEHLQTLSVDLSQFDREIEQFERGEL
ncbi:DUF6300 family protein [Kitasatospora cineracea]